MLDDEERVEPVQSDRVEVKQIAGQDRLALCVEELGPGRLASPRRGVDARRVEDLPYGGGAESVAESCELVVHAPIPPGRILGGQTHGQGTDARGDGGAACPQGWVGPSPADELAVPAQDRGWSDQESAASTSRKQSGEGGDDGAV